MIYYYYILSDECQTNKFKLLLILSEPFFLLYSNSNKAKKCRFLKGLIGNYLNNVLPYQLII